MKIKLENVLLKKRDIRRDNQSKEIITKLSSVTRD